MKGNEQHILTIDELERKFAQASGIDLQNASEKDKAYLQKLITHIVLYCEFDPIDPETVCEKLRLARETGKRVRIVRDRKPWDNDPNVTVLDGETFHLELYTPRTKK